MRRQIFSVILCLLFFSGSSAFGKDSPPDAKAKAKPKLMVPTLPPPTAEWPEFPPATSSGTGSVSATNEPAKSTETAPDAVPPAAPSADAASPAVQSTAPVVAPAASSATEASPASASTVPPPVVEQNPAQMEPHKRPVPPAYAAAAELYKQKKFPQAAKAFESIIQSGVANVDTHLSLAYCYLLQRLYSKAVREFEWVAKYGKNSMTLQKQCGQTASALRTYMSGVCPAPCLKANDPRWAPGPEGLKWIKIQYSSKVIKNVSQRHLGEYVANENGVPTLKGTCPVCGGTGRVKVPKDGDPTPRI